MSDQPTCKVHGTQLQLMKVPLIYGSPVRNEDFAALIEARQRLFPNANSHKLGGCQLGAIGYETEALVCNECRKAERKWSRKTGLPTTPEIGGLFIA